MKSKLIIIEGIDGSGTTTQASLLNNFLRQYKIKVKLTKEPFKRQIINLIKESQENISDIFLFLADRSFHYLKIKQWLKEGYWVISDRSFPSTLSYQWYFNENIKKIMKEGLIIYLNKISQLNIIPDLVFILDTNPKIAIERLRSKNKKSTIDKFERLNILKKVRRGYIYFAKKLKWKIINGNKSITEVHKSICQEIKNNFNLK
ncbi:MAG: thymidylate kinase [Candidatus Parcubacteria bacterium]|nr:MAG: thymidylate kinase [Candidatus Parcubacteria bacterium]